MTKVERINVGIMYRHVVLRSRNEWLSVGNNSMLIIFDTICCCDEYIRINSEYINFSNFKEYTNDLII